MKITKIETIRLARGIKVHAGQISWLWVRIHTDEGATGLGETYPAAELAESAIRNLLAPVLLGCDPRQIDRLWSDMMLAVSYHGWAGAEMRAISAIDIALWDHLGKLTHQPIYQLLGGKSRDRIRTYNTCYDHIHDFNQDADKLAQDLLASGIEAMKIWPFDAVALQNQGQYISPAELEACLTPVCKIRDAVGDRMEIAMEFHGYWNLPSALRIARALEPYRILWLEEMLPQDNLAAYRQLADETRIPLILSERFMTRYQFREAIELGAAKFVNPDICWCGGISEAKRIASLAETHYLPVAPHNCGGPILHAASIHLAANLTNLFILESVRAHYLRDYRGLISNPLPAENGFFRAPEDAGLGVELDPNVFSRPDVTIQTIGE
ncbi:MAG: mandelate racemase/muconate lactonizing enzyme family protein [Verrucomicrobia bacterium]|nr:mandelate racemase/muconate lactonizing enzyme family protein [Verrucomicrobiota bacterium]